MRKKRDPIQPLATSIHPGNGKNPIENKSLSTPSMENIEIGYELINRGKYRLIGLHRTEVDSWIGMASGDGQKAASWPTSVRGFVALNEAGTQRIGEFHARAKLSDAQVEEIRSRWETGNDGSGPKVFSERSTPDNMTKPGRKGRMLGDFC